MPDQPAPVPAGNAVSITPIATGEKRHLQALLWALKPLANLRGSLPLPVVTTFLLVALDEGKGVGAYAQAFGMHRSIMSRYLHDLADRARNGGPGLGLIAIRSHPTDPRRRQIFLTESGRLIAGRIFRQIRRGGRPFEKDMNVGAA
jgi:DNA-binding MarR family transcriptional regulator